MPHKLAMRSTDWSQGFKYRSQDLAIIAATALLLALFAVWVPTEFRADEFKTSNLFFDFFGLDSGKAAEIVIRIILIFALLASSLMLRYFALIRTDAIVVALLLPQYWLSITKFYFDIFAFFAVLIRYDLKMWQHLLIMSLLTIIYFFTGEGNLLVALTWRLFLLIPLSRTPLIWIVSAIIALPLADFILFSILGPIGFSDVVDRFLWTRDIANPEYNIAETALVFITSSHLYTLHTSSLIVLDGVFGLAFFIILVVVLYRSWTAEQTNILLKLLILILLFTEVTHAFQNARYYFYFIPLIAFGLTRLMIFSLAGLGVVHVLFKAAEIQFF